MLSNIFKKENKKTGYEPKSELRSEILQSYAEFGVTTEAEAKYVDNELFNLAEAAAGVGIIATGVSAVIGAAAAAVTISANSIEKTKEKNAENYRIMNYRIDCLSEGMNEEDIKRNEKLIRGKRTKTIAETMREKAASMKEKAAAKLEAAKEKAAAKGAKK